VSILSILLVVGAGAINAAGSSLMKYAMTYRSGAGHNGTVFALIMIVAMGLFGGGFPLYAIGLSRTRLSVAQPVFSATAYLSVTLVSVLLLKEAFAPIKLAGLAAIVIGMLVVAS
jgi:multidrug transporter EmrE-like cation transporter